MSVEMRCNKETDAARPASLFRAWQVFIQTQTPNAVILEINVYMDVCLSARLAGPRTAPPIKRRCAPADALSLFFDSL